MFVLKLISKYGPVPGVGYSCRKSRNLFRELRLSSVPLKEANRNTNDNSISMINEAAAAAAASEDAVRNVWRIAESHLLCYAHITPHYNVYVELGYFLNTKTLS